jgi:hypothetical protein
MPSSHFFFFFKKKKSKKKEEKIQKICQGGSATPAYFFFNFFFNCDGGIFGINKLNGLNCHNLKVWREGKMSHFKLWMQK